MILITGGSGLLGSELKKLLPEALTPTREELNVNQFESVYEYFANNNITYVIHCAGLMPASKCNEDSKNAIITNIIGTSYITLCSNVLQVPLIYISTDYVFKGDKGMYKEDDELLPTSNYAWSKLGGECAVRMYNKGLIVRTSFGPKEYPFYRAFGDQYTSKETVDIIAKKIVSLMGKEIYGVIHLGGKRKTVYEYAKEISPEKEIEKSRLPNDGYIRPVDSSLDTSKFEGLK